MLAQGAKLVCVTPGKHAITHQEAVRCVGGKACPDMLQDRYLRSQGAGCCRLLSWGLHALMAVRCTRPRTAGELTKQRA